MGKATEQAFLDNDLKEIHLLKSRVRAWFDDAERLNPGNLNALIQLNEILSAESEELEPIGPRGSPLSSELHTSPSQEEIHRNSPFVMVDKPSEIPVHATIRAIGELQMIALFLKNESKEDACELIACMESIELCNSFKISSSEPRSIAQRVFFHLERRCKVNGADAFMGTNGCEATNNERLYAVECTIAELTMEELENVTECESEVIRHNLKELDKAMSLNPMELVIMEVALPFTKLKGFFQTLDRLDEKNPSDEQRITACAALQECREEVKTAWKLA
jgi:hypothetical protein